MNSRCEIVSIKRLIPYFLLFPTFTDVFLLFRKFSDVSAAAVQHETDADLWGDQGQDCHPGSRSSSSPSADVLWKVQPADPHQEPSDQRGQALSHLPGKPWKSSQVILFKTKAKSWPQHVLSPLGVWERENFGGYCRLQNAVCSSCGKLNLLFCTQSFFFFFFFYPVCHSNTLQFKLLGD